MEKQTYTISVYTEDNIGILNRLSGVFLKRHINIESMTVCKSEIEHIHRFIFVIKEEEEQAKKAVQQLEKQIEVIGAFYHSNDEIIYQETAMFKISTKHLYNEEIQEKLKLYRANVVLITERYFVIETTGTSEDIDVLYERLKPYGLLQFVRSGHIAITRPKMAISEMIKD